MIFNGMDLREYFKILKIQKSILPPITNYTRKMPGKNGAKYIKSDRGSGQILVDIELKSTSKEDLKALIRQLASMLYTEELKKLKLPHELDKYYMAKLDGTTNLEEILYFGKTTLTFISPDPDAYGDKKTLELENGMIFVNSGTSPTTGTITIEITENTNHLQVTLQNTGEFIYLEDDFIIGDTVQIDLSPEEEYINKNGYSLMPKLYLESDFFKIPVGEFAININSGNATLEYIERWL